MNETLKELRRAAELVLSGSVKEHTGDLKNVLKKTTKATKVARGSGSQFSKDVEGEEAADDHQEEDLSHSKKSKKKDNSD